LKQNLWRPSGHGPPSFCFAKRSSGGSEAGTRVSLDTPGDYPKRHSRKSAVGVAAGGQGERFCARQTKSGLSVLEL